MMEGYRSVTEVAERDGLSCSYVRAIVLGKIIRQAGEKRFIRGKMKEGEDFRKDGEGKIWIRDNIRIIRGKVIR
jgi:hypothetical protein